MPPLFSVAMLTTWRAIGASGHRLSPPHVAWPHLTTALDVTEEVVVHSTFPPPLFGHAHHCSAPRRALLHCCCLSPMSRPKLSDRAKRCTSSPRLTCTKSLPAAPASETGPREFPAVVFLYEHLTGGGLLRLFPHPINPTASSAPLRSSSPTSSSTTSTTPSAPH
jgi:hypothetical protein